VSDHHFVAVPSQQTEIEFGERIRQTIIAVTVQIQIEFGENPETAWSSLSLSEVSRLQINSERRIEDDGIASLSDLRSRVRVEDGLVIALSLLEVRSDRGSDEEIKTSSPIAIEEVRIKVRKVLVETTVVAVAVQSAG
jgi:hypothetical protein